MAAPAPRGLLGADLVGFQLPGGAANFASLVRPRVGHKTHRDLVYCPTGARCGAGAYPISIDFARLEKLAKTPEVTARAKEIRGELGEPRKSSSAWTGSTTPRGSTPGCAPTPS